MRPLIFIILALLGSSCKLLLGVRDPYPISELKLQQFNAKYDITQYYEIDNSRFFQTFAFEDSATHKIDELSQPLQVIVFDQDRNNICHLINCNIGGLPLKWNRFQSFDSIPILPNDFLQPEHKVQIHELQQILKPKLTNAQVDKLFDDYDYVYFVYYAVFLKGFTKPFLRYIQNNISLAQDVKVKVVYINNDRFFYHLN